MLLKVLSDLNFILKNKTSCSPSIHKYVPKRIFMVLNSWGRFVFWLWWAGWSFGFFNSLGWKGLWLWWVGRPLGFFNSLCWTDLWLWRAGCPLALVAVPSPAQGLGEHIQLTDVEEAPYLHIQRHVTAHNRLAASLKEENKTTEYLSVFYCKASLMKI